MASAARNMPPQYPEYRVRFYNIADHFVGVYQIVYRNKIVPVAVFLPENNFSAQIEHEYEQADDEIGI